MVERLYILDAHSLIYQVFYAIPEMAAPDGTPTNAIFGFVRDIQFIRKDKKPEYLVCAFDAPGDTFRHEIYDQYKAQRAAMPDDLRPQIEKIFEVLQAFRIPVISLPGYEADDVIATVATVAANKKIQAYLCTADKDVRQSVNDYASVYDLRRNRVIDREYILKDWGVTPEQVVDYQAMVGDSVDNIPGIPGVGPKTARELLEKYQTLDNIYEHIDEIPKKGVRKKLLEGRKLAFMSRDLVRLHTEAPLPESWDDWRLQEPDVDKLIKLFGACGFHRFIDEIREEFPQENEWVANYHCVNTLEAFDELTQRMQSAKRISFELESNSDRPCDAKIVGYAVALEPGEGYYVPVDGPEDSEFLDPQVVLDCWRPLLEDPSIEKVGQNLKFALVVLKRHGVAVRGLAFDTMIGSYLLEPGERNHTLSELSQRFLAHKMTLASELFEKVGRKKAEIRLEQVALDQITPYACEGADVALRLVEPFDARLREDGLKELFDSLELPLIEVLAAMEYHGIRVDRDRLRTLSEEFAQRLAEIRELAFAAGGRAFNLDSPTELRVLLFEELKLPILKRTKTGPSTDQEVLEELAARHPVCDLILEHRKLAKLKGTYLDSLGDLINSETGRIHASFNQTVAATGRLSSSDPNLQNIPVRTEDGKQIRQAFLAGSDEQLLLSADYSQIELRLLAHFSGDRTLRQAFVDDQDIHAIVASQISGVPLDEVTSEWRRRAKAVNFGIMYGLSPFGLARQLKISRQEASEFIDAYFEQYPSIGEFFTRVLQAAKKNRYVQTILGRRRPISGVKNVTGKNRNLPERTAVNTVIQGSAADLIKQAMCNIHRRLQEQDFGARMLLQIHDELVFEVDADRVGELGEMVVHEMTTALPLDDVPVKVDVGVGHNWLDLTPLEEYVSPVEKASP